MAVAVTVTTIVSLCLIMLNAFRLRQSVSHAHKIEQCLHENDYQQFVTCCNGFSFLGL